jgi:hypothetical protein
MPPRLKEYVRLIVDAVKNGYEHITIPDFYNIVKNNTLNSQKKYFIHRHDIDSDTTTARSFWEIEKKYNIKTSFYFRLSTLDIGLMREIHQYGSEVGYHYEELAQYCKDHSIKSPEEAKKHFAAIIDIFKRNFKSVESKTGFKIRTIASHGDFVNRKLNLTNFAFITDKLMQELNIDFECYNELLLKNYGTILSDLHYPAYYRPRNPFDCIKEGHKVIYLLSHPRHWRTAPWVNTKDNLQRIMEGIKYSL